MLRCGGATLDECARAAPRKIYLWTREGERERERNVGLIFHRFGVGRTDVADDDAPVPSSGPRDAMTMLDNEF